MTPRVISEKYELNEPLRRDISTHWDWWSIFCSFSEFPEAISVTFAQTISFFLCKNHRESAENNIDNRWLREMNSEEPSQRRNVRIVSIEFIAI